MSKNIISYCKLLASAMFVVLPLRVFGGTCLHHRTCDPLTVSVGSTDSTVINKTVANRSDSSEFVRIFSTFQESGIISEPDIIKKTNMVVADSTAAIREKALQLDNEVQQGNLMIANLNELTQVRLPVGLQKQIGPLEYTIIFSSLESTPIGSFIEAYFMFEVPATGDKIAFHGTKIPFSNTKGFAGRGRLQLVGDYHLILNSSTLLTLVGKGNSFVEFDCEGFAGMGLEANVEFSRDLIVPEDSNGELLPVPARVQTHFEVQLRNWNDILIGINLPAFQVNGLKDVSFTVKSAFLDWSDLMNPAGMQFPQGYVSPFLESGQPSLWQGIFIQRLDVSLPKSFSKKEKKESDERITIGVENMILDDQGFTGKVFAENVLSAGDMNGWAFTIDKVSLDVVINQVRGFEVDGQMTVPRLKTADDKPAQFAYKAHRGADGNFLFAVTVAESLKFPLFNADMTLFAGSGVTVVEKNDKFFPTAELNGELSIKEGKAKFDKISFQGLRISTEEPKLDIEYVGYGNSDRQKVSSFPVVINGISLQKTSDKIGLGVDLTINIGGSPDEAGFGGGGKVIVWGKQTVVEVKDAEGVVVGTDTEWKFDRVEIGAISIHAQKPNAYELSGSIQFFDGDAVYGDGFKGAVTGKLGKIGPISVQALFGNTGEFRYWYADALVKLPTSIPIIPGVLFANSFGGGFYSKMKQTDQRPTGLVQLADESTAVYYVPDKNTIGIKAIMGIESARKEAMNGVVMLELMMNRHGGINSVTLSGNAEFMSFAELATSQLKDLAGGAAGGKLTEKLAKLAGGQIRGSVRLMFDNVNDVFHGNMEIFINVAGGLVKGVGANGRAGWAVLHFEKGDWYILIGTPTDPIGLEVARVFQAKSYFMLGKNLPGSPPPPSQVTEILGPVDLDYMRDMNALQTGAGFAFGLHFLMDTGDLRFLMFYGRFAAGAGIDFMLKDYGTSVHCQGSSGPIGINGWYANGQAYAFVMGKIGIRVRLKFYKGDFDILAIGAAAVLQAKGPNPFWMKGMVGGYYSILGGMVKGKCNFEVEVGQKCVPVGEQNLLADQKMIAEVSPASGTQKVDVFSNPQVAFNIPVGQIFEITDLENRKHYFRASLGQFGVFDGMQALPGRMEWNEEKNVVILTTDEIMPGEKDLKVKVKLTFEERKNGSWSRVLFEGSPVEELREVSFKTDKAPNYIPEHNVLVSYPLPNQRNFYPREYDKGMIALRQGQAYLFSPGHQWIQKVRMTKSDNSSFVETNLTYNTSEKKVLFTIPSGFENSKVYTFEVLNVPRQSVAIDANVKNIESQLETKDAGSAVLTTKELDGQLARLEVESLYEAKFRTSKYNTFTDKVGSIRRGVTSYEYQLPYIAFLCARLSGDESFDPVEMAGTNDYPPVLTMEADLQQTPWYLNNVHPILYSRYPYRSVLSVLRETPDLIGIPPKYDISIEQNGAQGGGDLTHEPHAFSREYFSYNVMRWVAVDYYRMQHIAINYVVDHPGFFDSRFNYFSLNPPPYIRSGSHPVKLSYKPPGAAVATTSILWDFINTVTVFGQ